MPRLTLRWIAGLVLSCGVALVLHRPPITMAAADIVIYASEPALRAGSWRVVADATAAGGSRLEQPNVNATRITTPLANPVHYVEYPIAVEAGTAYHLWIRGKALNNFGDNDSIWVQTSGTIDANGGPLYRIGTTSATMVNLEDCSGCTLSGWGWQDNGFGSGVSGPLLTFAGTPGTQVSHTLRIQAREDGISIDQIVLSDTTYLDSAPGLPRNDSTILPRSGGTAPAVTVVRGPYLQQVGASGAIVAWATREPGPASVIYWTGSEAASTAAATTTFRAASSTGIPDFYQHEAVIHGIRADTVYQYDLRVAGRDATPGITDRLRTSPPAGTGTIRLVAFGDSGVGSTAQQQVAARLDAETFDVAIHTGDIAYSSGTYAEFQSRFFPYYGWLRAKPVFPAIGNHENLTGSATPWRQLFVLPRDGASPAFPNNAERFYSFDYGPVHLVVLDTESAFLSAARREEQLAWLEDDLVNAQTQPWRVAVFHRPPYSASSEHGSDLAIRQAFGPLFERYHVELVLNGHGHCYERTVPIRASTDPSNGAVTYVVTGGGGAALHAVGREEWTAFSRSVHHYVRATVSSTAIALQAIDVNGTVFDSVRIER